jgi:hypothetical protein
LKRYSVSSRLASVVEFLDVIIMWAAGPVCVLLAEHCLEVIGWTFLILHITVNLAGLNFYAFYAKGLLRATKNLKNEAQARFVLFYKKTP